MFLSAARQRDAAIYHNFDDLILYEPVAEVSGTETIVTVTVLVTAGLTPSLIVAFAL